MKMTGWKKVFKFTFIQNIKNKSFIISTIVMNAIILLMVLGINFIPPLLSDDVNSAINGGEDGNGSEEPGAENGAFFPITEIYFLNETGITALDLTVFEQEEVKITEISAAELAGITEQIHDSGKTEVLVHIKDIETRYDILVSQPADEELVGRAACQIVASSFAGLFESAKMQSLGISDEAVAEINKAVYANTTVAGEQPKSEFAYMINTFVPMLSSIILFIFILSYGQIIAQAVATEKTSRVMELLLTSVRPLAVIIGKILAIGLVSLTQLTFMALMTSVVFLATAPFGLLGQVIGMVQSNSAEMALIASEIGAAFGSFNPMTVVWIIVLFVLGFIFYALIAGLIGASISRLEDLNIAMQPMVFISLLGFYLSYIPSMLSVESDGPNTLAIIARYLPISSPFALPSSLILGEIGALETILSVVILAAFDILMFIVVARVYESIVLHTGDRIKLKDIIKLARAGR